AMLRDHSLLTHDDAVIDCDLCSTDDRDGVLPRHNEAVPDGDLAGPAGVDGGAAVFDRLAVDHDPLSTFANERRPRHVRIPTAGRRDTRNLEPVVVEID